MSEMYDMVCLLIIREKTLINKKTLGRNVLKQLSSHFIQLSILSGGMQIQVREALERHFGKYEI